MASTTEYVRVTGYSALFGLFGPDTGNFTIACPGHWDEQVSSGWFYEMARRWQTPLIPIINSNNAGSTTLVGCGTDVGACVVDTFLAELDSPFSG